MIKDDEIHETFSQWGKVKSIHVIRDPFTKDTRGFGFVTMESSKDAESVIDSGNKSELDGKTINIEVSKRSKPRIQTPGIYLGPAGSSLRRPTRYGSPKRRRYSSRSRSRTRSRPRSRSRSRSYGRERNYKRQR